MKKVLLILLTVFAFNLSNAQWETKYYLDEFDQPTEKTYEVFLSEGTFSNSATTNSKATYAFFKNDDSISIKVYEYGRSLASSIENTYEAVKLKTPSGDVVVFKGIFFWKKGQLLFSDGNFTKLSNALSQSGEYIMVFNRSGKYSESSYKVSFIID